MKIIAEQRNSRDRKKYKGIKDKDLNGQQVLIN